jgi:acetylornithine/succinyldiaminopimelate/putrescine aminotransferase
MDPARQPYDSRRATEDAFADHVNRGKVELYRSLGLELVMGERRGAGFADAFGPEPWTDGYPPYFNCHCNGGVFNLGHRNEAVVDAVRRGLDHLDVGNHHLVSGWRAAFAERLAATTGGALPGVVFGVSGGEAVDLAIKVARAHTGRPGVVSALGGYHGCTGLAMSAGSPEWRDPFGPTPAWFRQVPYDDLPALEKALSEGEPPPPSSSRRFRRLSACPSRRLAISRAYGGCATSTVCCSFSTRCRPGSAAPAPSGSTSSRTRRRTCW